MTNFYSDDCRFYRKSFQKNTTNHSTEYSKYVHQKYQKFSIITFFHEILGYEITFFHNRIYHRSDTPLTFQWFLVSKNQLFNNFHCPKTQLFKFWEMDLALFHYLKGVKLALLQKCLVSKSHHIKTQLFSIAFGKCNCFPLLFKTTLYLA